MILGTWLTMAVAAEPPSGQPPAPVVLEGPVVGVFVTNRFGRGSPWPYAFSPVEVLPDAASLYLEAVGVVSSIIGMYGTDRFQGKPFDGFEFTSEVTCESYRRAAFHRQASEKAGFDYAEGITAVATGNNLGAELCVAVETGTVDGQALVSYVRIAHRAIEMFNDPPFSVIDNAAVYYRSGTEPAEYAVTALRGSGCLGKEAFISDSACSSLAWLDERLKSLLSSNVPSGSP